MKSFDVDGTPGFNTENGMRIFPSGIFTVPERFDRGDVRIPDISSQTGAALGEVGVNLNNIFGEPERNPLEEVSML